jgi:hypothetical protein
MKNGSVQTQNQVRGLRRLLDEVRLDGRNRHRHRENPEADQKQADEDGGQN